jgi:ABC-type phosphate transport system substrate-binding protein
MKTKSFPALLLTTMAMTFGATTTASAQTVKPTVNCKDASRPNLVYTAGSTAIRPFLTTLSTVLAADNVTIVYQGQGSCVGVSAVFDPNVETRKLKDVVGNWAVYYKPDGTSQECWLDQQGRGEGFTDFPFVDIGISDVFQTSCPGAVEAGVPISDYFGPIQPMVLVVPAASSQRSISIDAAYMAFGLGSNPANKATPWTDPNFFFVRNASSGTQQMVARAINVPAEKWWGKNRGSAGAVAAGMKVILDPATAEKSIGIVSTDFADVERDNLRVLAFKARGQTCGYLPDSSPTTKDKSNVRDGHYPIWGPVHLFARTNGGVPVSAPAATLVGRFATARVDQALTDAIIAKGLVPQCAMKVTRSTELGALTSFQPNFDCGCYFDFKSNGRTSCKTCNGPGDCAGTSTPACNFGYCEKAN